MSKKLPGHSEAPTAIHVAPFTVSWEQMTNSILLPAEAACSSGTSLLACPWHGSWQSMLCPPQPLPCRNRIFLGPGCTGQLLFHRVPQQTKGNKRAGGPRWFVLQKLTMAVKVKQSLHFIKEPGWVQPSSFALVKFCHHPISVPT